MITYKKTFIIEYNGKTYTVRMTGEQLAVLRWLNTLGYDFKITPIDIVEPVDISDYAVYLSDLRRDNNYE